MWASVIATKAIHFLLKHDAWGGKITLCCVILHISRQRHKEVQESKEAFVRFLMHCWMDSAMCSWVIATQALWKLWCHVILWLPHQSHKELQEECMAASLWSNISVQLFSKWATAKECSENACIVCPFLIQYYIFHYRLYFYDVLFSFWQCALGLYNDPF